VEHYVGIDVSLELSSVCVVDGRGKIVKEAKVASEPEALVCFFKELGVPVNRIGLEAGPLSQWLHAGLTQARHRHQPSADRVFTNKREHSLVQFLVLRLQSCAHRKHRLSNAPQRGLTCHQFPNPRFKRLARHLADLQAEAAQDSPNAQFHVQQPSEKLLARNQQRPHLLRSNRFGVHLLEPSHPQQMGKPTRILAVRLHRHRRQCRLHITFKSAVDDPSRITKSKAVGALFGLTPRKYQSGEKDVTGGITRTGDEMVRTALYEAANVLLSRITRFSKLKRWGMDVAKRRGSKRAKVALARKIGIILHRMWIDGTTYRWAEAKPIAAQA
jgi:transposase